MNTRVTVFLIAFGGFIVRFLRLGTIENDHYVYLARAHQMLHGDWPVRDFVDPGFTFGYLLSAGAAALTGPSLLTEAVVSVAFFTIALAVTFWLVQRACGSTAVGVLMSAALVLFPPRLYNSSKMMVLVVAIAIAWAYSGRPTRGRAAALGLWTAVAFLFRHDYAVYIAAAALVMLGVQHRHDRRLLLDRALIIAVVSLGAVAPWLIYVQLEQGLPAYLSAAMRFSEAESNRTVSHWSPIYYVMTAVPAAALLIGLRGNRGLSAAQVTFATVLVVVSDLVLLRDAPGARLPDVYATTAIAGAIALGALAPPQSRSGLGWKTTVLVLFAVVAATCVWLISQRSVTRSVGLLSRWHQVATRLREARPEIMPNPERALLVAYIERCTATDERVLVGGFGPELPVLSHRAFAGGLPDWIRGYYDFPADVARARTQLARERVGVAVMLDGGDAFAASWPALASDLRDRAFQPHYLQLSTGPVELWIPPRIARDRLTGLPCVDANSSR